MKYIILLLAMAFISCTNTKLVKTDQSMIDDKIKLAWSCQSNISDNDDSLITSCNIINSSPNNRDACLDVFYTSKEYSSQYINVDYICLDAFPDNGLTVQVSTFTRGNDYMNVKKLCGSDLSDCSLLVQLRN